MVEQRTGGPEPDVVTLELPSTSKGQPSGGRTGLAAPPKTRLVTSTDAASYARKADRVTVHHPDGDVVAVIEIVSPGNKDSKHALRSFVSKSAALLHAGVHLLVVDLFPPSKRDPQGIHKAIWDRFLDEPFELPPDKPLTLAAYAVGTRIVAHVEPVAVGDALPDMPVFLTGDGCVLCPLEATYATAWEQFPAPLRQPLE